MDFVIFIIVAYVLTYFWIDLVFKLGYKSAFFNTYETPLALLPPVIIAVTIALIFFN